MTAEMRTLLERAAGGDRSAEAQLIEDNSGFITVTVRLFEGRMLALKVQDTGRGIANVEQARQPMFTTGDDTRSGMGFTIMETFTD